jgi:hypothetical protein
MKLLLFSFLLTIASSSLWAFPIQKHTHFAAGIHTGISLFHLPEAPRSVRPHMGASARFALFFPTLPLWQFGLDTNVGIGPRLNQNLRGIEWHRSEINNQERAPHLKDFSYFHVGPSVRYQFHDKHSLLFFPHLAFTSIDFSESRPYFSEDEELKMSFQTFVLGLGTTSLIHIDKTQLEFDVLHHFYLKSHHWSLADKDDVRRVKTLTKKHQNVRILQYGLLFVLRYHFF